MTELTIERVVAFDVALLPRQELDIDVVVGFPGRPGNPGTSGKSAYQHALDTGYTGTLADWLASMKGEAGKSAFQFAQEQGFSGTVVEWLESLNGEDGASAYELAVRDGFVGSVEDFLASLVGASGSDGRDLNIDAVGPISELSLYDAQDEGFIFVTTDTYQLYVMGEDDWLAPVPFGNPGKSAYELAVDGGYEGSLTQWLAALKGTDGKSAYEVAVSNGFSGNQVQWLSSLIGDNGLSAFELAQNTGFTGTLAEWLDSLVGGAGKSVSLRATATHIQMQYTGDSSWTNLVSLGDLTGSEGKSAYQIAVLNGFIGTEVEWLASLVPADGKSAYQIALDNGFVGSVSAWLESLEGSDGSDATVTSAAVIAALGYTPADEDALAGLANKNWITVGASYQAVSGDLIIADTSAGSFSLSLPIGPTDGDTIEIQDLLGCFIDIPLTVTGGDFYLTLATTDTAVVIDISGRFSFIYVSSLNGWVVNKLSDGVK